MIMENLKMARNRQKSYVDNGRRDLESGVRDKGFPSYLHGKGPTIWKERKGKLSLRYIGPDEIVE